MPAAAIASALVLHAVSIGALMAFGYGIPAQPAPAAVVEVAVALELSKPTPVASAPMPEPPVAEPVAPFLPEQPVAVPSPAIATLEPPVPPPVRPQPMRPPTQHAPHTAPAAPRTINMPQDSAANGVSAPSTPTSAGTLASVDQEAALEARIRDAVQAAVRYPPAARMMGVTGRARVRFDYRSGSAAGPTLAQSSGTPMLDEATLAAARAAHYPPAPAPIEGRLLRLLVWVEFQPG